MCVCVCVRWINRDDPKSCFLTEVEKSSAKKALNMFTYSG